MGLQFYKPNQKNTGNACSFSVNAKDFALYANFVHQTGPKLFKGGKQCAVKFSMYEVGGLIDTIEKGREFKGYHKLPNGSQIINFKFGPYYAGEGDDKKFKGFGLSITRSDAEDSSAPKETFSIGFTPGEAVTLREYLRFTLGHIFNAIYSADKQARNAGADKAAPKKEKAAPKPKKEEKPSTGDDPFADDPFEETTTENEVPEGQVDTPTSEEQAEAAEKTDETQGTEENTHQTDEEIF